MFLSLLYPPACLVCHASLMSEPSSETDARLLCASCEAELPMIDRPVCIRCGTRLEAAIDARLACRDCRLQPPAFTQATALWDYEGRGHDVVRHIKYQHGWRLGQWVADQLTLQACAMFPIDLITGIVAVPTHPITQWWRGYDVTPRLASAIAKKLRTPYLPNALHQRTWRSPQHRLTSKAARWRNVRNAFRASDTVQGQTLLLVDDVMTSRATAHACATALMHAGAVAVYVLTMARTPAHG